MRSFKPGRFVKTPHGTGIVFKTDNWPNIDVHLINKQGETIEERTYDIIDIALADKPLPMREAVEPQV